jgi:hypothetical protein
VANSLHIFENRHIDLRPSRFSTRDGNKIFMTGDGGAFGKFCAAADRAAHNFD